MKLKLTAALLAASFSLVADDRAEVIKRINESGEVFREVMKIDDKAIPQELLERARCVAIIPGMKKGAFIVGAQYGKGVMTCRGVGAAGWSAPSMVRMEGGSIGAQIGGSESDLILVVMNREGAEKLMKSEFTLGGDVQVAAGPVGRHSQAKTDAFLNAGILAYSRSRGAFAGISLTGGTLREDHDSNVALYNKEVTHEGILMGKTARPQGADVLYASLNQYFKGPMRANEPVRSDADRTRKQ